MSSSSSSKKPSSQAQIDELLKRMSAQDERISALETAPKPPAEKKPRKKRAPKNPDAPKRAPSSWIVFCGKKREEAKTAHPDAKMTELTTILAEMWAALTPDQKAMYKPAAAPAAAPAAKPTFQEAREVAATMSSTVAAKFLRFCVMNPTLDAKTAETRWKALSPEDKAKFDDPGDDTEDNSSVDSDSD
jgi:hypothetical protein